MKTKKKLKKKIKKWKERYRQLALEVFSNKEEVAPKAFV